ncbi:DUF1015 domain-containing protein [bacterium]
MAKIVPIKGITYNQKKANIQDVTAPPYDVIDPKEQNQLYKKSVNNVVKLILGKESKKDTKKNNKYTRASKYFHDWVKKGILEQDSEPCLYFYRQDFKFEGKKYSRTGFICGVKIEPLFKGTVYPHERTLSKPKADRLNLMRACSANFSQVFSLYEDKNKKIETIIKKIAKRKPHVDFVDNHKERNRVWKVSDASIIMSIQKLMTNKKLFIADGHHRYETALNYSKEMKGKNNGLSDYVMMFLCSMENPGLAVFPTHRLVNLNKMTLNVLLEKLAEYFDIKKIARNKMDTLMKKEFTKGNISFSLYDGKSIYFLVLKDKNSLKKIIKGSKAYCELDVAVLESLVFEDVLKFSKKDIAEQKYLKYVKDLGQTLKMVKSKKFDVGFVMNPPTVKQIESVALNLETMPQKSTYFYPKLLSGLVLNGFENEYN